MHACAIFIAAKWFWGGGVFSHGCKFRDFKSQIFCSYKIWKQDYILASGAKWYCRWGAGGGVWLGHKSPHGAAQTSAIASNVGLRKKHEKTWWYSPYFFSLTNHPTGGQANAIASNVGLRRDPVVASRRNKPVARLCIVVKRISNILLLEYVWPFLGIWASCRHQAMLD